MRLAISAKTKLEAMLRYLAIGDSFKVWNFCSVFQKTISKFILDTCGAIYNVLTVFIQVSKIIQYAFKIYFLLILT